MSFRWPIAFLVSAAIVLSYLDRQTLPWTLSQIHADYPFSDQIKALFDSAFLISYGLMYLGGGMLLDKLGTRRGFLLVMIFWSLASASHGLAANYGFAPVFGMSFAIVMLVASRCLLGMGEGGGFPAATRVVAEWFPVNERASAMGLINTGTAVGAVVAPWLILVVLNHTGWFGLAPWRWVFFCTGTLGLLWAIWWWRSYFTPEQRNQDSGPEGADLDTAPKARERSAAFYAALTSERGRTSELGRQLGTGKLKRRERRAQAVVSGRALESEANISLAGLLRHRETWAIIGAKFLSDGAWYFYLFWLPKFLMETFQIKFSAATGIGWIPYAASGVGSLVGGGFSSRLLARGSSVNASRKLALGASAALMPWVMLVPQIHSVGWVIFIFSLAFFGQQSWSTLVMILPTDMVPKHAVGTLAGLVGFGGAMGGVLLGQIVGWLRDHGYSYSPALALAGTLHVAAFLLICVVVPKIQPLKFQTSACE
jgi:ACS family hexuronate transporter-like MFS transporter